MPCRVTISYCQCGTCFYFPCSRSFISTLSSSFCLENSFTIKVLRLLLSLDFSHPNTCGGFYLICMYLFSYMSFWSFHLLWSFVSFTFFPFRTTIISSFRISHPSWTNFHLKKKKSLYLLCQIMSSQSKLFIESPCMGLHLSFPWIKNKRVWLWFFVICLFSDSENMPMTNVPFFYYYEL